MVNELERPLLNDPIRAWQGQKMTFCCDMTTKITAIAAPILCWSGGLGVIAYSAFPFNAVNMLVGMGISFVGLGGFLSIAPCTNDFDYRNYMDPQIVKCISEDFLTLPLEQLGEKYLINEKSDSCTCCGLCNCLKQYERVNLLENLEKYHILPEGSAIAIQGIHNRYMTAYLKEKEHSQKDEPCVFDINTLEQFEESIVDLSDLHTLEEEWRIYVNQTLTPHLSHFRNN